MADLPSYARPTTASENRRAANVQDSKARKHSYEETRSQRMLVRTRSRVQPQYSHSTVTWRSKGRWTGPFRFLDLPPEIRNRIYEQVRFDEKSYYINLYHTKPDRILGCLPPLLATSKQLCDEAGGYYFLIGVLVFTINGYRIDEFSSWLSAIGPKNRQRLADNMNVTIRLFIPLAEFECDDQCEPYRTGVCLRGHMLSDLTYLVGLGSEFDDVTQTHPSIKGWHVEAYVTPGLPPQTQMQNSSMPRETRFPTPHSHFEQLLPFLRQLLELFGGTQAETLGGQLRGTRYGPIWFAQNRCKGVQTISLPSGLKLSIDSGL